MNDDRYMEIAIEEALRGKGNTLPNPAVGAVIVKNGRIVATGFHEKAGMPHAEAVAIEKAGEKAKGATIYVTLEPCNHYGRTPPCTEKIIKAGIKRAVIGVRDPNPVASGGIERLKEAGIEVTVGVKDKECRELIDDFTVLVKKKRAFCSLKLAMTLDGKIARKDGSSKWITGEQSRQYVHRLRTIHNGVMVGIGTVLKDDPLLNVRLVSAQRQPKAIVVDRQLRIPVHSKLVKERASDLVVITTEEALLSYKSGILRDFGVTLIPASEGRNGVNLKEALKALKEIGIYSVMCEGGSRLAHSLINENLADKFYLFYAPKFFGSGIPALNGCEMEKKVSIFDIEPIGEDFLIKAYPEES
ncbi:MULTISPECIES: bifunctional diaminohydroxyphosphoribosylaminopyrimidine deaminase/5-amino-6-(5-phosphoribosylamino)uracil reductase RibD [unclassified Desulfurobacterium]|uniref:bifunctional diaminohydroxyphosphoribosylaminopyrimidine deaminase/5-amino-6-(5-phosphoribosylamino)uracil reductase RibD n=1 Tax=Desulfurobacterium sp. TC5-1 TaxID=1158318 RepID=UPI0003B4C975|nr:bifunctional diaminohydroxyphosphoribosylaminopyrimidine deaminase/5-amino-6-(5-phosphoribosylamino)uracil reductase RibD [Desulfurobacterium sp. TC5-1]